MSTTLEEESQRFTFDADWVVFKYDGDGTGYFEIRDAVAGSRACDFLGLWRASVAYLIEVKDFRGYRIQNKHRLGKGELALEVAQKVRDTLAGIVSGCRRADGKHLWRELRDHLTGPRHEVIIVLCLEDDGLRDKVELGVQAEAIRQKLAWLCPKVRVVSQRINPDKLPGVVVTNLPGAGGHVT
jgi:hypothetical protein